jgi:hypothetical protein
MFSRCKIRFSETASGFDSAMLDFLEKNRTQGIGGISNEKNMLEKDAQTFDLIRFNK